MTPSAVTHHFGSEENLLKAVLDEFDDEITHRFRTRNRLLRGRFAAELAKRPRPS